MQAGPNALPIFRPHEVVRLLAPLDLQLASREDCELGRALAAQLISPAIALTQTLLRVQARCGAAIFVQRAEGNVTGVTTLLPLRPEGKRAIENHAFDTKLPPDELLCAPGDPLAAVYPWGFAATTRRASAAVVSMVIRLREYWPEVPFFTRAVTASGARVVRGRMRYSPYPGAPDDLLWNPVPLLQERVA